jgi:proteasome accessory factor B
MSKRGYISSYLLILKKLKVKPYSTYEELQAYIENQFDYLQMQDDTLNIGFSKRTLQRDIKEIRNVFGIDIEYSKSQKGYFISQNENENMNFERMMEAFDMFNSLNLAQDLNTFYSFGKTQTARNRKFIWFASCNQKQTSNQIHLSEILGRRIKPAISRTLCFKGI